MKLSDAANRVIDLAGKVRAYYDAEFPKWHPKYPIIGPDEEGPPPPPEEKELRNFLDGLSEEMIYQLLVLMYLGRGDFGAEDLAEQYEAWNGVFGDAEHTAPHLMYYSPLADYLLDGLEELRKHKINVDKLPLRKVKARKR